ncbi:Polyadenylate-binding protein-interacting protein 13 [Frankliniella fusca]|uniref:Polyadenylate-binding protein-interacting protein 13 n=1 Tax=Frankliniella fusca TaxID=407009 RepID=A0AAE1GR74_9NEOP|nr:Polyadenylate-binding protein-interacting protein 13 [Frankliniella fusca]
MTVSWLLLLAALAAAVPGALPAAAGAPAPETAVPTEEAPVDPESTTASPEELHQCGEQTVYDDNLDVLLNAIDVEKLLQQYGGPAGHINESLLQVEPAALPHVWDNPDYFTNFFDGDSLRNDSLSDNSTFIRVEQRALWVPLPPVVLDPLDPSSPSSPSSPPSPPSPPPPPPAPAEERVRGELRWRPADLCGYLRTAEYSVSGDPPTLQATVRRMHCAWEAHDMRCFGPDATPMAVFASPNAALIATLVGGK